MRINLQDKAMQFNDGHITTDDNYCINDWWVMLEKAVKNWISTTY